MNAIVTRNIKIEMVKQGYTQETLAKKLNLCTNSINRKICGVREFTLSEALRLCEVLKIEDPKSFFLS